MAAVIENILQVMNAYRFDQVMSKPGRLGLFSVRFLAISGVGHKDGALTARRSP